MASSSSRPDDAGLRPRSAQTSTAAVTQRGVDRISDGSDRSFCRLPLCVIHISLHGTYYRHSLVTSMESLAEHQADCDSDAFRAMRRDATNPLETCLCGQQPMPAGLPERER